ncbi:MAG: glycosyltransferase family 2 protein [Deltaproteobacteria bacterium]|nr:glycosyltransferase family 2 protein [Deltaproteobacteria bacterium]
MIGLNEGRNLRKCLESARKAAPVGIPHELIYVDGGSEDGSMEIAGRAGADVVLGGDRKRRAAENRNLGLQVARGRFIQFLDGDMTLNPEWPSTALEFLQRHPRVAAVCGNILESRKGLFYQALEIDWNPGEGEVRHCGGAALWRREVLDEAGGFPETVSYGEEPYLCWKVRNRLGFKIYHLNRPMVRHDLGFSGWGDYWHRDVRCGETYAEIASLCWRSRDPLWLKDALGNLLWAGALAAVPILLITGPARVRWAVVLAALLVVIRKGIQMIRKGNSPQVAFLYALQVYFSKIPIAWGECRWIFRRFRGLKGRHPFG